MNKFCVIGNPINHSLSPVLFRYFAKLQNRADLDYQKLLCTDKDLSQVIDQLKQLEYLGANITLPFKEKIIPLLDEIDKDAQKLGAVNVLRFRGRKIKGFNTDIIGIRYTFKKNKISLKGKSALVFGAGGAARSVCFSLAKMGCKEIYLQNRTVSKAKKIIKDFSPLFPNVIFKIRKKDDHHFFALINTTPLGLKSHPYKKLIKQTKAEVAFDLLYSTDKTPFLKEAQKQKMILLNGMDMFVSQALASMEIWTKKFSAEEKKDIHQKIVKYLKRMK